MSQHASIIAEFESLGDNCEFGFVQRHHGLEPGGLLRWASSTLDGLVLALERRFAGLYQFEDLAPYTANMVIDRKYDIAFHSEMHSKLNGDCLEYALASDELRAVHRDESEKISYLIKKLTDALSSGRRIFVYKRNSGVSQEEIIRLRGALDSYGTDSNSRLLCVVPAMDGLPTGTIKRVTRQTKLATIEKLAPYEYAESALYDQWTAICREVHAAAWN
jgi:hypothetical protein